MVSHIMVKLIWKSIYTIEPKLNKSENVGDYFFQVNDKHETFVERDYETSSFDEIHPESKHKYEYAEETLSRIEADAIKEILLKRMVYQCSYKPIKVTQLKPPILINKEELKNAGVKLKRSVGKSLIVVYDILDVNDSLAESEAFWQASFQEKAEDQQKDIIRIADWFERSVDENDPIKSFILTWIGFNGLYNLLSLLHNKSQNDAEKFIFMINQLLNDSQAINIIDNIRTEINMLKSYNVKSESGTTNWSNELHRNMNKPVINSLKILVLVIRCIYGVRKQVFHEAPKTVDIIERVITSRKALKIIASRCLKNIVTH